jgi:aromatic-L-amino-acid/L-tryptophan decarboxylase
VSDDPLALTPDAMRALGHRAVDLLVDRLTDPKRPVLRRASAAEMQARIAGPPPAAPQPLDSVLERLEQDILPYLSASDHPRYFAFIPSCPTFPGAVGDFIAAALNVYAGSWMEAAGPSQVELTVLDWFKDWLGYAREAAGILVSGASAANLTALACAGRGVVYVSDQAHSSLARAARALGLPDVRVLDTDDALRMRPETLAAAIDADARAGRTPLLACATAGTTNTGAIDPLPELAEVCRARGVWLYADAAPGGFAALTERGRAALRGIEAADSIALDPHKWLYQPIECGCLLVRDGDKLRRAFATAPDYLADAAAAAGEVNFSDLGLQLTRGWRALKVWLSIQTLGLDAFRAAIDRCLDLAAHAEARIRAHAELELLSGAQLGVVCFRRRADDAYNAALVAQLAATGEALVSSTRLRGRYAIRLCVLNHTSRAQDVDWVLDWLATR